MALASKVSLPPFLSKKLLIQFILRKIGPLILLIICTFLISYILYTQYTSKRANDDREILLQEQLDRLMYESLEKDHLSNGSTSSMYSMILSQSSSDRDGKYIIMYIIYSMKSIHVISNISRNYNIPKTCC